MATPFLDMLPSSIKSDAKFIAAAAALDVQFARIDAERKRALIWSRIDDIDDEALLANLAWQLHLDAYEGWPLAETLKQKRQLVKSAIPLHFYKGTRWSVERVFELLDMRGKVVEWWEAPDDQDFHPYEFDIEIDVTKAIHETLYGDLNRLIDALKNLRSHRRQLKINYTLSGSIHIGATAMWGIDLAIYPFMPSDMLLQGQTPNVRGATHSIVNLTITPFGE